jgi:hypothetical protein
VLSSVANLIAVTVFQVTGWKPWSKKYPLSTFTCARSIKQLLQVSGSKHLTGLEVSSSGSVSVLAAASWYQKIRKVSHVFPGHCLLKQTDNPNFHSVFMSLGHEVTETASDIRMALIKVTATWNAPHFPALKRFKYRNWWYSLT